MPTQAGRDAARRAVLGVIAKRGWNPARLADEAGIDCGTAGDFLLGKRWPKVATLGKIDVALGWIPGTLAALGEELIAEPESGETVSVAPDTGDLVYRRPDGLTDDQWVKMKAETGEWLQWQADRARRAANAARGTGSEGGTLPGLSRSFISG